jgi:hypothetical protein
MYLSSGGNLWEILAIDHVHCMYSCIHMYKINNFESKIIILKKLYNLE